MRAEVTFALLLSAARALKPYTTPPRRYTSSRLLYLHAAGATLTLTASSGEETAIVSLSGAVCDGGCALPPETFINALTVLKPAGRGRQRHRRHRAQRRRPTTPVRR
jgi:hypothetical protein